MFVTGDMTMHGVNAFTNDGMFNVSGSLHVDSSGESEASSFIDNAMASIGGDFQYLAGDNNDQIILNTNSFVGGNIDIKAGQGNNTAAILGLFGGTDIDYLGGWAEVRKTIYGPEGVWTRISQELAEVR